VINNDGKTGRAGNPLLAIVVNQNALVGRRGGQGTATPYLSHLLVCGRTGLEEVPEMELWW